MPRTLGLLTALVALAAAAGQPAPRMKPGDTLLTIYTPTEPDESDPWDRFGYWGAPSDDAVPSHQLIERDARRVGFGVVRQCRRVPLKRGANSYRFTDVAAKLDATTVRFLDQTDPRGTRLLEQNFLYDLVNQRSMLRRFVDRPIEFVDSGGTRHKGTLLGCQTTWGGWDEGIVSVILRTRDGGVTIVSNQVTKPHTFRFPDLPANYQTRPTLEWQLHARQGGDHDVVLAYMTGGMAWRADYIGVVNADDTRIDLSGWVTIANLCGAAFPDARVKLIAGNVRRIIEFGGYASGGDLGEDFFGDEDEEEDDGFEEKGFFEYHLYTLGRRTTLANNQTKQIEFLHAPGATVQKVYTYDGADLDYWEPGESHYDETYGVECRKTVRVNLEFVNSEDSKLGMPLPAGILRFYKRDEADDSLEFIGESKIEHTPRDERVRFYLGDAFDVVGERVRKDYKHTRRKRDERHEIRESFEITLRNHKDEAITVHVLEHLYRGTNWQIERKSHPFTKRDARSIEFAIPVPARGEATITYKVLYWWPPGV